jgi:hypothetical protein
VRRAGIYAPAPTERVHSIFTWLQQLIIERIHAGGCKAPPPVQSVIQGVLSDLIQGYEQCMCAHSAHAVLTHASLTLHMPRSMCA